VLSEYYISANRKSLREDAAGRHVLRSSACQCPSRSSRGQAFRFFRELPSSCPLSDRTSAGISEKDRTTLCISYSTGHRPSIVPSYRSLSLRHALPFERNMNVAIQIGIVSHAICAYRTLCPDVVLAPRVPLYIAEAPTAGSTSNGSRVTDHALLIATRPRLEIVVTRSFKRRKHFLTATRMRVPSASRFPAPAGYSRSTELPIQFQPGVVRLSSFQPSTSNPQIASSLVFAACKCYNLRYNIAAESRSKQRAGSPINRQLCGDPVSPRETFSRHSLVLSGAEGPLATSFSFANFEPCATPQFPGNETLRPARRSAKIE
jgi:hypothetical protein